MTRRVGLARRGGHDDVNLLVHRAVETSHLLAGLEAKETNRLLVGLEAGETSQVLAELEAAKLN